MRSQVQTVSPETPLPELESLFLQKRVSGFPVVDGAKLVGIVSRTDIVRQLCVERSIAQSVSDYYHGFSEPHPDDDLAEIADRVGERIEHLRVRDVMVRHLITVSPDEPLESVARALVEHRIHRVPVAEGGELRGIISSLDLVRLIAEGRVKVLR
jgi:CBS domain-containing protein